MSALKIVFITNEKQIVLYAQGMKQMWQVETHVLERLGEVERQALANATFHKYWIDDESDRVEIMNDVDFDFFLKQATGKTPKIYFEAIASKKESSKTDSAPQSTPNRNAESLSIHPTVECDVCLQAPIRGFRYKCLQCPNFDLCMNCEAAMKHPEHLMLRIPTSNSPKLETVCPIASVFGRSARRQQKHAARAAALANAAALAGADLGSSGADGCGKSRHHRHHRKACSGGAGLLSNFYDMMQDLAEGGGVAKENPETPRKAPEESAPSSSATSTPGQQPQSECPIEHVITSVKVVAEAAAKEAAAAAAAASVAATASANAAAAAATNASTETNTTPDRRASTSSTASGPGVGAQTPPKQGIPVTPSLENLIDPNFMKAGIQILNNFSEMFGKILDPVVTEGGVSRAPSSVPSSAPESVNIDLTTGANATPPPTAAETPNKPAATSNPGSGFATPMETETSAPVAASTSPVASISADVAAPVRTRTQSEENDWTMIETEAATAAATTSAQTAAAAAVAAASNTPASSVDFIKLSQQLQSHIEREMKANSSIESNSPAPSVTPPQISIPSVPASITPTIPSTPAPTPAPTPAQNPAPVQASAPVVDTPVIAPNERRAIAVFHADPRINNAIHGMMAMGFSNEGAVLTQLLESVNGNIPLALDLMAAAQR